MDKDEKRFFGLDGFFFSSWELGKHETRHQCALSSFDLTQPHFQVSGVLTQTKIDVEIYVWVNSHWAILHCLRRRHQHNDDAVASFESSHRTLRQESPAHEPTATESEPVYHHRWWTCCPSIAERRRYIRIEFYQMFLKFASPLLKNKTKRIEL